VLEFYAASALLFAAACCVFIYFPNDRAIWRFRNNPDPARIETIRKFGRQMVAAALVFFGCFLAVGAIVGDIGTLFALAFVLAMLLRAMFGASRTPLSPESLPPNGGGRLPWFAAASSDDGSADLACSSDSSLYKVFIAPATLSGAQVVNQLRKDGTFKPTYWNALPWRDALFYDAIDVASPGFCRLWSHNFQIAWRDVANVEFDPEMGRKSVGFNDTSGSVIIRLKSGEARKLVVRGRCDAQALCGQLKRIAGLA